MNRFQLDFYGRAYCRVAVKPRNSQLMLPVSFKVDTGADFTTISKGILYNLGYDDVWINENKKHNFGSVTSTASGEAVDTYFIQLPVINIYGYEAVNWPFAILFDGTDSNGNVLRKDFKPLLGLDLLAGFKFTLDNENDSFELTRIGKFKNKRKRFANQEIHEIVHP